MSIGTSKNIKIGILISILAMASTLAVSFFFTPFLLDKIGDRNYGIYEFAISLVSILTFALGTIGSSYNKFASDSLEKRQDSSDLKKLNFSYFLLFCCWAVISIIAFLAFFILVKFDVISLSNYSNNEIKLLLTLISISMVQVCSMIVLRVFNLYINFNNRFVYLRTVSFLLSFIPQLISIPFLMNGFGVMTLLIIIVICHFISFLLDLFYAVFGLKFRFSLANKNDLSKIIKPIFVFSSVVLLSEICAKMNSYLDITILGFFGYAEEITLYKLPMQLLSGLSTANYALGISFAPKINEYVSKQNDEHVKSLFKNVSFFQIIFWLFILGGFLSCGYEFVILWLGKDRIIVFFIGILLLFTYSACDTMMLCSEIARANNKHYKLILLEFITTLANGVLTIILVAILPREYSLLGCLVPTILMSIVGLWILRTVYNSNNLLLDMKIYWENYFKTFAIILMCSLISHLLDLVNFDSLLLAFSIKGFTFVCLFCLFEFLFNKNDIKGLIIFIRR